MLLEYLRNPICTLVWNGRNIWGTESGCINIHQLSRFKLPEEACIYQVITVWWYKYLQKYLDFLKYILQFLLHSKIIFSIWHRGSTISLHSISNLVSCISTTLLFSYNKFEYSVFRTLVGTRKQFYLFTLTGATAISNDGNTVLPPNSTSLS